MLVRMPPLPFRPARALLLRQRATRAIKVRKWYWTAITLCPGRAEAHTPERAPHSRDACARTPEGKTVGRGLRETPGRRRRALLLRLRPLTGRPARGLLPRQRAT